MHPLVYHPRRNLLHFHAEHKIVTQAYGSMFYGKPEFLKHKAVLAIAKRHSKSAAQVLLRWGLQKGFQVIPKSVRASRIEENARLSDFELTSDDVTRLDGLQGELNAYWDPLEHPVDIGDTSHGDYLYTDKEL